MVGGANLGGKEDARFVLLDQVHLHPSMSGLRKDGKTSRGVFGGHSLSNDNRKRIDKGKTKINEVMVHGVL